MNHLSNWGLIFWGGVLALLLVAYMDRRMRAFVIQHSRYDTPLREVIMLRMAMKREYFLEALKLTGGDRSGIRKDVRHRASFGDLERPLFG